MALRFVEILVTVLWVCSFWVYRYAELEVLKVK